MKSKESVFRGQLLHSTPSMPPACLMTSLSRWRASSWKAKTEKAFSLLPRSTLPRIPVANGRWRRISKEQPWRKRFICKTRWRRWNQRKVSVDGGEGGRQRGGWSKRLLRSHSRQRRQSRGLIMEGGAKASVAEPTPSQPLISLPRWIIYYWLIINLSLQNFCYSPSLWLTGGFLICTRSSRSGNQRWRMSERFA